MNSEDDGGHAESNNFIEDTARCILKEMNREDLQLLLTDDEAWENFVAEMDLSRSEAATLRGSLRTLSTDKEDSEGAGTLVLWLCLGFGLVFGLKTGLRLVMGLGLGLGLWLGLRLILVIAEERKKKREKEKEQEYRQKFLKEYPQLKQVLEDHITQLRALADKADKVHKDCTISQVVASSTSIVSGALTIAGLTLAPVTAGASLALTATGMGLGTAAAVTSVTTSIVDYSSRSSIEAEAKRLTSSNINQGKVITDILSGSVPKMIPLGSKFIRGVNGIEKNIHAIKVAKNYPRLVACAKRVMTTGRVSARGARQVQKAFGGTALAMSKGARLMGAATAGFSILMDVASLVQDTKHLREGAKTESAAQLRQQAGELEMKLEQLKQIHEVLQQGCVGARIPTN